MTISNFVAYVKQAWKNKPDTSTPLSAARLTHLEDGIKGNSDAIEKIAAAVVSQIVNDPNKIASMASLYSVNQAVTQLNSDLSGKLSRDARVSEIGFSDSASDPATIYVVVDGTRLYIPAAPSNFGIKRLYVDDNPDTGLNALRVDWIAYGTEHTNWIDFSK